MMIREHYLCAEEECRRKRERWNDLQKRYCPVGQKELEHFQDNLGNGSFKVLFDKHFGKRSFERSISPADFHEVLKYGWVVERNKTVKNTSIVVLGYIGKHYRPLHIVLDMVSPQKWVAITVYDPQSHAWKWNKNFNRRICFCNPSE